MAQNIGRNIEDLRNQMAMNQSDFGKMFKTSAMSISRWERNENLPGAHDLLQLGLLAQKVGTNGWMYWQLAGLARTDARAMLDGAPARAAAAGRG